MTFTSVPGIFIQHVSSQRAENILFIKRNLATNGTRYQFAKLFNIIKICAAFSSVFCHIRGGGGGGGVCLLQEQ